MPVTGLEIDSLCANLDIFVEGRALDDNAEVLIKYTSGARGIYWCSQVAIGYSNGLIIRVLGEKGSVEWEQEKPDYLKVAFYGRPVQILSRGRDNLYPLALRVSRLPGGHPQDGHQGFDGQRVSGPAGHLSVGCLLHGCDRYQTEQR